MQQRYLGLRPFDKDDAPMFWGRENEVGQFRRLVQQNELAVLCAPLGYGKSSFLQAGIIPALEDGGNYCIYVRLNGFVEGMPPATACIDEAIKTPRGADGLHRLTPGFHGIWHSLKRLQRLATDVKCFVLVVDQFEEAFSYPAKYQRNLFKELAELLSGIIPMEVRKALEMHAAGGGQLISSEEEAWLYRPMQVKAVLAIGTESLHLLNHAKSYLPGIYRNLFELRGLSREAAEDAISMPASYKKDGLSGLPFNYTSEAMKRLLDFLESQHEDGLIAPFELQMVCNRIAHLAQSKGLSLVEPHHLNELGQIYEAYYEQFLQKIETEEEREKASALLEKGLVSPEKQARLLLPYATIQAEFKVGAGLLALLVEFNMLHKTIGAQGEAYYEIKQDIWLKPILKARAARLKREEAAREEAQRLVYEQRLEAEKRASRRKLAVFAGFSLIICMLLGYVLVQWQEAKATKRRFAELQGERMAYERFRKQQLEREMQWLEAQEASLVSTLAQSMPKDSIEKAIGKLRQELNSTNDKDEKAHALESLLSLLRYHSDTAQLPKGYEDLSWHLLETHQFLRAIKVAHTALALDSTRLGAKKNLAIAYFLNQQYQHGEDIVSDLQKHSKLGHPITSVFLRDLETIASKDSTLVPIIKKAKDMIRHDYGD